MNEADPEAKSAGKDLQKAAKSTADDVKKAADSASKEAGKTIAAATDTVDLVSWPLSLPFKNGIPYYCKGRCKRQC